MATRSPSSSSRSRRARRGTGMVELMIALTLFTVVLLSSMAMVESGRRFSRATMHISTIEDLAQQMLFRLEQELATATGVEPTAIPIQGAPVGAGETGEIRVVDNFGFPPTGTLLLDRGTPLEERISYGGLDPDGSRFLMLRRGEQCTEISSHDTATPYAWAGAAVPIENQTNPPAGEFDGQAQGETGDVFFRGDGYGFVYRIPVDPTNNNNPLIGNALVWGAEVPGIGPTADGWMAVVFVPKDVYDEAITGYDVNEDGDRVDVFDVGQIRRLTWSTTQPDQFQDIGMGPSNVLQERCNYGGDLNGDGLDDPIFLWDEDTNLLEVRLYLLGRGERDLPIVRRVQSVVFLRNEPEL